MKIKSISINKYKAFQRKEDISIEGKNVFIYGENGSGKSSFYYAIKDFFQSSVENIDIGSLRNLYLTDGGTDCSINIEFDNGSSYELSDTNKTTINPSLIDCNRLKRFITYKHLLGVHNVKINSELNIFDLVVKGVLKHFKSQTITNGLELVSLWDNVITESKIPYGSGKYYHARQKRIGVEEKAVIFNNALDRLFHSSGIEYLGPSVNQVLGHLVPGLEINFLRHRISVNSKGEITKPKIALQITSDGTTLDNHHPHFALNEAKLSAIAISIFLGAIIKQAPFSRDIKILFLDDILIGLDSENRLNLLKFLTTNTTFNEFQIFITTYDRHWFEVAKVYLSKWKFLEFYKGSEGPEINDQNKTELEKAEIYFKSYDFPASANSLRKVFEQLLLAKLPETYTINEGIKSLIKPPTLDTLINRLRMYYESLQIQPPNELIDALKIYKSIVLNPMSHNDISSPIYKNDLETAFQVVKMLQKINLPKQEVLIEKSKTFEIEIPSINYIAKVNVSGNIYKIDNNGEITYSEAKFNFLTWSRENIEYAKPVDSPPVAFDNDQKLADILKPAYSLDRILYSINTTLVDRGEQEIDLIRIQELITSDGKTLASLFI